MYTPVTTEAFATYGVVDNGAIAQPLQTPTGVVPQYGGLEIDTSSTAMQALTDAVVYLEDYPVRERRRVRVADHRAHVVARCVRRVRRRRRADRRRRSTRGSTADIKALAALQNDDGGFSTWTRGGDPQPYISVQATEALVLARHAGFAVPDGARNRRARVRARHRVEVPDATGAPRTVTR